MQNTGFPKQRGSIKSPMVNFKALSNAFDEENNIGPNQTGRVKGIYKRFETQQKTLNKLGVDKTKKE